MCVPEETLRGGQVVLQVQAAPDHLWRVDQVLHAATDSCETGDTGHRLDLEKA